MAATVDPPHLMDILTLADDLGVSVSHTRRLVHERQIPFITLARLVRFDQGRYQPQRHRILVTTERVLREVTGPGQTRLSRSTGVRPATWSGYPHPPGTRRSHPLRATENVGPWWPFSGSERPWWVVGRTRTHPAL